MGRRVPFDYQVHFSQHECFWVVKCADFSCDLGYHWYPQRMQPPDLGCRKPCKYWYKLPFPQLVLAGFLNHQQVLNLLFFPNPGRPNWTMLYEKESCKVKDIHIFYIWSRYNKHMIIDRCVYTTENIIISLHTILSIFYIKPQANFVTRHLMYPFNANSRHQLNPRIIFPLAKAFVASLVTRKCNWATEKKKRGPLLST